MKLNYREKIILSGAVIVITLILGIIIVILPAKDKLNESKVALATSQQEYQEYKVKKAKIEVLAQERNEITKLLKEDPFILPDKTSDQRDKYIYDLCQENDVKINIRNMSILPYTYGTIGSNGKYFSESSGTSSGEKIVLTSASKMTFTFKTTPQQRFGPLLKFLDKLDKKNKAVIVDNIRAVEVIGEKDQGKGDFEFEVSVLMFSKKSKSVK